MYAYRSRSWLSVMVRLLHFVRQTMWYVRLMWLIFFVLWGCCIGYAVQRGDVNVEVKPSRLLLIVPHYRGRCPRLPTSASRCVQPSRLVLALVLACYFGSLTLRSSSRLVFAFACPFQARSTITIPSRIVFPLCKLQSFK
mgnify:CR=1 FL=1